MSYQWTSEAVSPGHPDKVADQIADAILDAYLLEDEQSRVAAEVVVTGGFVLLVGEALSKAAPDLEKITRQTIRNIGYDDPYYGFDAHSVEIVNKIRRQSPEIAKAVAKEGDVGAGDQGIMFGYATNETSTFMPLAHYLSFKIIRFLEEARNTQEEPMLCPDAKSQVTVRYDNNDKPLAIDTVVVSTQQRPGVRLEDLQVLLNTIVIKELPKHVDPSFLKNTKYCFNPAGAWYFGGPAADTGLSGRKIVVDNYGADCPIGGGSFSGKDPTKVDRSAAYAARHVAKNIVAAGLADRVRVQLSYAIGVSTPISIRVQSFGLVPLGEQQVRSLPANDEFLTKMVQDTVLLSPKGIIDKFDLRHPIHLGWLYEQTSRYGHFGHNEFPWEKLNLVDTFKAYKP